MAKAQVKTIICYQSFCSSPFKIYHRCNYSELMYSILKRTRCTMVTNQILLSLTLAIAAMFFLWKQTFMANGSNIVSLIRYNHGSLSSIKKSLSRCQGPTPIESRTFGVLVLPKKCIMLGSNTKSLCIPPKVVILLHCKHQTSLLISKHLPLALSRSTTMVSASATSLASAWELWTVGRCVSRGIPNGKMCGQTNFHI